MGKKTVIILIFFLGIIVTGLALYINNPVYTTDPVVQVSDKLSFGKGEVIEYRAHYGFLNAAVGKMRVSDTIYNIDGKNCLKIEVIGESVGMFNLMLNIEDVWGTYLDTSTVLPQRFWRKIKEGNYRKYEIVDFDQQEHKAEVITYDYKRNRWKEKKVFDIPRTCQDLVSGYYFLRTIDLRNLEKGDIITLDGFFDNEAYHFKIRYLGRERLKTKIGTFNTHFFAPIMPKNSLFDGENSIKFWLSADQYKIPLKIKADMFVGAVEIDITNYKPAKR